jgi:hypothetical protein
MNNYQELKEDIISIQQKIDKILLLLEIEKEIACEPNKLIPNEFHRITATQFVNNYVDKDLQVRIYNGINLYQNKYSYPLSIAHILMDLKGFKRTRNIGDNCIEAILKAVTKYKTLKNE